MIHEVAHRYPKPKIAGGSCLKMVCAAANLTAPTHSKCKKEKDLGRRNDSPNNDEDEACMHVGCRSTRFAGQAFAGRTHGSECLSFGVLAG